ncbi:MAG: hypothetical protein PHX78_10845 [bacterium]|nr:hypothetical protein [bacterium]
MKIKGKIQKGFGAASSINIPKQKPFFKKYIPNIDSYHTGTINLLLDAPLVISSPDIETEPIEWVKNFTEIFGFLKIKFETIPPSQDMPLDALIYIPYRSPYYTNHFYKEIMAPKINLEGIEYCNIIIDKIMKEIPCFVIE